MSFPQLIGQAGTLRNDELGRTYIDWLLINNDFTSDDWLEAMALYSPSQLSISGKRSRATLTGLIPFEKVQNAILWLSGFSWVDEDNLLRRNVPANHPLLPGLFCNDIVECVGYGPKTPLKLDKPHPWSLPYGNYELAKITASFSQPPFDVLPDSQMLTTNPLTYRGQELRRWVSWSPTPEVEMLEVPIGSIVFNGGPYNGKPILTPRTVIRKEVSVRKLIWWDVPLSFVCDQYGFMTKIEAAIGKVNSDDFFGVDNAYTWLLDKAYPIGEVYSDPIATQAMTLDPEGNSFWSFARRVDLCFVFKYFNPTMGVANPTTKGWRSAPGWDGKWYPIKRTDGGEALPQATEFGKLFTHWSDA